MKSVVHACEQTFSHIEVTNGVDSFREMDTSWQLTITGRPLVLNALHVPLVDDDDNFLVLA